MMTAASEGLGVECGCLVSMVTLTGGDSAAQT